MASLVSGEGGRGEDFEGVDKGRKMGKDVWKMRDVKQGRDEKRWGEMERDGEGWMEGVQDYVAEQHESESGPQLG